MRMTTLGIPLIALALTLACGQAQETAEDAASAAAEAADVVATSARDATDVAAEAAAEAKEAASEAAAEAMEAASDAAAVAEEAAVDLMEDPVARCSELAAQGAWSEALEVCTKAHEAEPDNMAIEHALQQAQAAAE